MTSKRLGSCGEALEKAGLSYGALTHPLKTDMWCFVFWGT